MKGSLEAPNSLPQTVWPPDMTTARRIDEQTDKQRDIIYHSDFRALEGENFWG